MNLLKKLISVFLSLVLCFGTAFVFSAEAAAPSSDVEGTLGGNITYKYTKATGNLALTGSGEVENFGAAANVPWSSYANYISSVSIGEGITNIPDYTFQGCTSIKTVSVPSTVSKIGKNAFYKCTQLASCTLPDALTEIGESAFFQNTKLTSINIPDGITELKSKTFYRCTSLPTISAQNVRTIGSECFAVSEGENVALTDAYFPAVEEIGAQAFFGVSKLENFDGFDNVVSIGNSAFYSCSSLKYAELTDNLTYLGTQAFYNCASLEKIVVPSGISAIPTKAFYKCTKANEVIIADSVTSIASDAFTYCSGIKKLTIPISVPFNVSNAKNIEEIVFSPGTGSAVEYTSTSYKKTAFYYSNNSGALKTITFVEGVTGIGDYSFFGFSNLQSAVLPRSLQSIGENTFSGCTNAEFSVFHNSFADSYVRQNTLSTVYLHDEEDIDSAELISQEGNTAIYRCGLCNEDFELTAQEHVHNYNPVVTPPTCSAQGFTTYTCECGSVYLDDYTNSLGHSFTNYISDSNATCLEDGTKTAKCDRCEETNTINDEGSALGHSFTNYLPDKNATCLEDGTKTAKCDRCEETDTINDEGSALGHSFTNYASDKNATCLEDGTKTAKCDRCEETNTITDEGSALDHSFTNYVSDNNATCLEDGTKTAKCDRCEVTNTITDEGSALGHSFTNYISDSNATCLEDGTKTAKCDRCEETNTINDEGSALGHSFTNYISDKNATCLEDGTKTAKCDRCEVTNTIADEGSVLVHSPAEAVIENRVEASCSEKGSYDKVVYCSVCKTEISRESITTEKVSHTDSDNDGSCDSCGLVLDATKNCSHFCHKTDFFSRFIYTIARFFWRLFGVNKYCSCGAAHY